VEPFELATTGGAESGDVVEAGSFSLRESVPDDCGITLFDVATLFIRWIFSLRVVGTLRHFRGVEQGERVLGLDSMRMLSMGRHGVPPERGLRPMAPLVGALWRSRRARSTSSRGTP
jgi:hypothetical protein